MTLLSKASLVATPTAYGDGVLNSVKPTDGAGDFDFARASSATRVNEQGLIEKGRENLLLQSNSFDTTWTAASTSVTSGQTGYDGSSDAWELSKSNSSAFLRQNIVVTGVHTISVYAKAGSLNWMRIGVSNSPIISCYFDIANGTIGTKSYDINAEIISAGNGWYRCSVSYLAASHTGLQFYPADGDNDLSGTSGNIYIQDAQLEQGLVATDYIETTTSSVAVGITNDIPRINYENGIGNFLLEPQRTNLVPYSEYSGHSSWVKANASVTDNSITSPEGVNNAFKISENSSGTNLRAIYYVLTSTSAVDYTHSVFLKEGSLRYGGVRAMVDGGTDRFFVNVDLQEGIVTSTNTVGSSVTWTYGVEFISDGWYRVWITGANTSGLVYIAIGLSNSATPSYVSALPNYNGTGSDYIYAYGAQLEAGYLTSYIPTYGSAVTRAAETCNNAGNSDLFNDSEGVLYAEISTNFEASSGVKAVSVQYDANNYVAIYFRDNNYLSARIVGSSNVTQVDTTYAINILYKIAVSYNSTNVKFYVNGTQVDIDTTNTLPTSLNKLSFDRGGVGGTNMEAKVKMVSTFTEALSDIELECLTSWSSFNRMATAQNYTIQ